MCGGSSVTPTGSRCNSKASAAGQAQLVESNSAPTPTIATLKMHVVHRERQSLTPSTGLRLKRAICAMGEGSPHAAIQGCAMGYMPFIDMASSPRLAISTDKRPALMLFSKHALGLGSYSVGFFPLLFSKESSVVICEDRIEHHYVVREWVTCEKSCRV